jgi:malate dehydrogenase
MSIKVTVLGAAGGIGQPLSLLLKLNKHITSLALYDVVNVPGVASDLHHIDTNVKVSAHIKPKGDTPNKPLRDALENSNVVIIPAGVPRKPGMTRGDLFNINASICAELAHAIAQTCPKAFVLVISNPVNSTVPIFQKIFSKYGTFDPKRLFGVTALDSVRSNTFLSELVHDSLPHSYDVTVVGGHSGHSIVPLFSQLPNAPQILNDETTLDALINRVQYGGDEVVKAKDGAGSSTLAMAYAALKFFDILMQGYRGEKHSPIASYVYLGDDSVPGVAQLKEKLQPILDSQDLQLPLFLATPITYGVNGVEKVHSDWVDKMNPKERDMFITAVGWVDQNIEKGLEFST